MKIIAVRRDYGVSDISDEEDVKKIVDNIDIQSNVEVQLDLSGCLIDYPATSKLVDKVVEQLSLLSGEKKIEIITDYLLPMSTIANWLFLGSKGLSMELKKGVPFRELIDILQKAIQPSAIAIKIKIKDRQGNTVDELSIPDK